MPGLAAVAAKASAAASPAGPAPMMPTLCGSSALARGGFTQPRSQAVSAMYFSTAPMVTLSKPFSMTQLPSQRRSCGQMRPQMVAHYLGLSPRWVDGTGVGGCSFMLHVRHAAAAIAAGRSRRASAITVPGIVLSQPESATMPSK